MPASISKEDYVSADGKEGTNMDTLCINTIRTLVMDAIQKAGSGHPGAAMSMAPVAYTLWQNMMVYDSADPLWPNRDRFVLSIGHASMLLYALIHLAGIKEVCHKTVIDQPALTIEDLRQFRQLGSRTPGHPEYGHTTGVETTTGPLGAGCATSVGMAVARDWLATRYNRPHYPLFDHTVYVLCGDGDMMEGVTSEAASFAGHHGLGGLVWIYDANKISIEGSTDLTFTESVAERFKAYGWQVLTLENANNTQTFLTLLKQAQAEKTRPTLIIVHSVIAWGAPHKAGKASAHGEPLGEEEIRATKQGLGWSAESHFFVPDGVLSHMQAGMGARGRQAHRVWKVLLDCYTTEYPREAAELLDIFNGVIPKGWDSDIPVFTADKTGEATRVSSGTVLNAIANNLPWLLGGSADLAPSTKTWLNGQGVFKAVDCKKDEKDGELCHVGRNIHFGVREHAMGAMANGMALYGLRPYVGGFLIFSDYMKASIRLSALMSLPVIYIFTHDSIGVGEDGPTHQPIEQLTQLRAIPRLITLRPADANEVAEAWRVLITYKDGPVALVLSRQNLPILDRNRYASASGVTRGGYILASSTACPRVIIIASGSEVQLAIGAYEALMSENIPARVVSMPSWELFEAQSAEYRNNVLPPSVSGRVVVEAASALGWERYAGDKGEIIALREFGASAPGKQLFQHFGLTQEAVLAAARKQARQ